MNIIQYIQKRADFLRLYDEKISDLQDAEGDWSLVNELAFDLMLNHGRPAFADAARLTKIDLDRRFDELFSAQGNLIKVTYSVNEKVFDIKRYYIDSDGYRLGDKTHSVNDSYLGADGLTVTALTDKYALGFNWYFNNNRANDKRLFFETLKYIHAAWRDTATGAQIADGEGLDRELQFVQTESSELKFSVILNAYQYCKLIDFTTSFDLFNAALLTRENGLSLFVRREPEIFFTNKVEVL